MSLTSDGIKYCARAAFCAVGVLLAVRVVAVAHDPGDLRRRPLTIEERAECHLAIEQVFWRHRTWPAENRSPKPRLENILSADRMRQQAVDALAKSSALGELGRDPVTPARLQAEMDRIARSTRDPKMLTELFAALENDPYLIAECLVRPLVADAGLRSWYQGSSSTRAHGETSGERAEFSTESEGPGEADGEDGGEAPVEHVVTTVRKPKPFDDWWEDAGERFKSSGETAVGGYQLPGPGPASCTDDTWTPTNVLPALVGHEAMWTGSEMIVWGQSSGSRYNPATDTWRPIDRDGPGSMDEAVWTGTEMFVWSGQPDGRAARYNPTTDAWATVSATSAPSGRRWVSLVWTGQEVILWGGNEDYTPNVFELLLRVNTGGRYNPNTDTWTATSTTGAPTARDLHSAVWTGTTMIVWGGLVTESGSGRDTNTGGRYNPSTNTWTATSLTSAPSGAREDPRLVWTGTEMIVWGTLGPSGALNAGGRYNPLTNVWSATSLVNAPEGRRRHTVVWSGTELIVWGGTNSDQGELNSGGRYNPATNTWSPTPAPNVPAPREQHSAIWTGTEMIVWGGGATGVGGVNDGGRYNPVTNTWTALVGVLTPRARWTHTATWTGAEMIVWGGFGSPAYLNTGASYAPATDSWTALPTTGAPLARANAQTVWTGLDVVVFGGGESSGNSPLLAAGGRYRPSTGEWLPMSSVGAPSPRIAFAMVWSGSRVVVWGGWVGFFVGTNTGGQYDPVSDTWTSTTLTGAPASRWNPAYVWTGSRMIVWGNTSSGGGRYDPVANSWLPMSTVGEPGLRVRPVSVWSGTEMIVWGGNASAPGTGGRYNPTTDQWTATSLINAPVTRSSAAGAWNGAELIVWTVGEDTGGIGARYSPATNSWRPISTIKGPTEAVSFSSVWTGRELIVWGGADFPQGGGGADPVDTGARYCAPPPPTQAPTIFTHPTNQTAAVGQPAVFAASATGLPVPGFRWQSSSNGGASWTDLTNTAPYSGSDTAMLTVSPSIALNGTRYRVVATNTAGSATSNFATLTVTAPTMALDRTVLRFGAVTNGGAFVTQTAAQVVRLTQSGSGTVTWTATPNQPWLRVSPASGSGSATLSISVIAAAGLPAGGAVGASISFAFTGASNSPGPITVTLTLVPLGSSTRPIGVVDTPADNRTGATGAIPFTGWALDDVEVVRVMICRAAVPGEAAPVDPNCGGAAQVFVGVAVFIDGARPDVQAAFPNYPMNSRGGWGFMVLTNMLPDVPAGLPSGGNGTYRFFMYAQDREGQTTLLGTRTMTCANAGATLPFGAIDTPTQGGVASGTNFVNFGWALAQAGKFIPTDGSTIAVQVDGVSVGTVDYNHFRSDIAALFPGLANSSGAIGFRILDTTTMTNGVHTIVWVVRDNLGNVEGIGSRFFTVSNGVGAVTAVEGGASRRGRERGDAGMRAAAIVAAPLDEAPVLGRRGWDDEGDWQAYGIGRSGRVVIRGQELERIELALAEHLGERYTAYLRVADELATLPIGSTFNQATGAFTWAPGVGFVGNYDLVFVRWMGDQALARHEIRIVLAPK